MRTSLVYDLGPVGPSGPLGHTAHGHPIKSRMLNLRAPDPSLDNLVAFVLHLHLLCFAFV